MKNFENSLASDLLQINAIKLNPASPFTWASGWKSPIYCDNRKTLSFPKVRKKIRDGFISAIKNTYPDLDAIAGVATGAIAHGVLVAEAMGLPFIYVRSSPKGHGLGNLIEGDFQPGKKYVVIEDLVSTGGSSLKAVDALRNENGNVLGMLAIFSYGFEQATRNFNNTNCQLDTLSNYNALIEEALMIGIVQDEEIEMLKKWRKDPENWRR